MFIQRELKKKLTLPFDVSFYKFTSKMFDFHDFFLIPNSKKKYIFFCDRYERVAYYLSRYTIDEVK